jgi:amidase
MLGLAQAVGDSMEQGAQVADAAPLHSLSDARRGDKRSISPHDPLARRGRDAMTELWQLDAVDLAHRIRTGRVTAMAATQAVLARIEAVNPRLNAIVRRLDGEALEAAAAADAAQARGAALGPLHGVPVTTKVNTDQKGHPTDNGVEAFRDNIAPDDAPLVKNLRAAGAVIVGRTNTPAFSMRLFSENALHGNTINPRDAAHTAGGSSGGAGSATAAGFGPIHQGNDIAGSVRYPAYCNGVVGLRPTPGRIPSNNPSTSGGRPIGAQLMAVQGPLTRSVRDARLGLMVLAGADRTDPRWVDAPMSGPPPARPIRVALMAEPAGFVTDPALSAATRQAAGYLARAGYAVDEVSPPDFAQAAELWNRIAGTDVLVSLAPNVEKYADEAAKRSLAGWQSVAPAQDLAGYIQALADRDWLLRRWLEFLATYPIVLMPSSCALPHLAGADASIAGKTHVMETNPQQIAIPLLGLPALQVPVGYAGRLRPGVQLVAARFREDLILEAGEVIEAAEGPTLPVDPL